MKLVESNKKLKEVKPSEIFDIKVGGDVSKLKWDKEKSSDFSFPIFSNGIKMDGIYGFCNEPKIKKESLTISARGTIGACFYRNEPFSPVGRLLCLSSDAVNLKYFFYLFQKTKLIGEDGAIKSLTVPMLDKTQLKYPESINEQKQIADLLDQQQSLIDSYKEKLSLLEKQESYYQDELLSGRLRIRLTQESIDYVTSQGWYQDNDIVKGKEEEFEAWLEDGYEGKVDFYENEGWNELEINGKNKKIPKDWSFSKLKNIQNLLLQNGFAFKKSEMNKSENNFLIKIGNIQSGKIIIKKDNEMVPLKDEKYRLQKNDIVIGLSGAQAGKVGIFNLQEKCFLNQRNLLIRTKDEFIVSSFNYNIKTPILMFIRSMGIPNISSKDIENIDIMYPNKTIEKKLIAIFLKKLKIIDKTLKEKIQLEEKKMEYLMDELLSGRIRIED